MFVGGSWNCETISPQAMHLLVIYKLRSVKLKTKYGWGMEWFSFLGHSLLIDIFIILIGLLTIFYLHKTHRDRFLSLVKDAPTAIFIVDCQSGEIVDASRKAIQLLSLRRVGKRFLLPSLISPQKLLTTLDAAQHDPYQNWDISDYNKLKLHFSLNSAVTNGQKVWVVYVSFHNVNMNHDKNTSLAFQALNSLCEQVFIKDLDGKVLATNRAYDRFWYQREQEGVALESVSIAEGRVSQQRWTATPDGDSCLLETHFTPLIDEDGKATAVVGISHDVSDWYYTQQSYSNEVDKRHIMELDLAKSESLLQSILHASPDPIAMFNQNRIHEACNQAYADSLGIVTTEDIVGHRLDDILPEEIVERFKESDLEVLEKNQTLRFIDQVANVDGKSTWYDVLKAPYVEPFTGNTGCLLIARDVTEQFIIKQQLAEANAELERLSYFDQTLQISNRRHFDEQLQAVWRLHLRQQSPLTVMICKIDFLGLHQPHHDLKVSSEVLINIASAFENVIQRGADLVASNGNDEFIFLLPETEAPACLLVADKIHQAMKILAIKNESSPISECLTVSIGVASGIPKKDLESISIVDAACEALKLAEQKGRNQTQVNHQYSSLHGSLGAHIPS